MRLSMIKWIKINNVYDIYDYLHIIIIYVSKIVCEYIFCQHLLLSLNNVRIMINVFNDVCVDV